MQIPILSGIVADEGPDFRTKYPRNMIPVPRAQGISAGYLRPADGITQIGTGPGVDRGAINWNGHCYRVMGGKLVRIESNGVVTALGAIAGYGSVSMDYSFDRLAIAGGGNLYYWNGSALTQVSDADLGEALDVIWVGGYFMTTDGTSNVVTDLNDPMSVNPLKYGSSEADPDPIKRNLKTRAGEVYSVNRYTIEMFENVGGLGFPFSRIEGAQINRGAIGTHCVALYGDQIAFLGGGRGEPPAIWLGMNAASQKVSTGEIDTLLLDYTEAQLAASVMETRVTKNHQLLYLHLPDQTLVYDGAASAVLGEPVWFTVDSGLTSPAQYRARNFVWCYDRWLCGDPTSGALGELDETVSTHYGQVVGWEFGTSILYNAGMGAIFHELELVALPGRVPLGADPVIWTSYSLDGETWSLERSIKAGRQGQRAKRLVWIGQGSMRNWRIQKFRGTSDAHIAVARLEAKLEPLNA
ncbi:packaged DNA stabilization protein [Massilia sp. CT11-137]|uniref:packaged DNA stabilization protein n=1 Tax=Massilia sp. CT11-137 TaxID=3393901 RepID=UPI0039AF6E6A